MKITIVLFTWENVAFVALQGVIIAPKIFVFLMITLILFGARDHDKKRGYLDLNLLIFLQNFRWSCGLIT